MRTNIKDLTTLELLGKLRKKTLMFATPHSKKLSPVDLRMVLTETIQANGLHLGKRRHTSIPTGS